VKKYLVLPLLLLAAALALTACGGSSGGGEEAAIEEAIEGSATSTEPSKCTEFQTAAFNEHETSSKGAEATKACEEEVEANENQTKSVSISEIKESGETATASVAVTGSPLNEQSVEVELAKEEGNWKLNKFLGFTKYDGSALAAALEEELNKAGEVTPKLAKCVSEVVAEASQEEAEEFVFEQNTEALEEAAKGCE
jgi:predicted small secreted protein